MHRSPVVGLLGLRLTPGSGRALGGCDDRAPLGLCHGLVVIVKQQWRQGLSHMPLDVVRQHTEQHMCPAPFGQAVSDRSHLEIDRLQTAKRALHRRQAFVGTHRMRSLQRLRGHTGPQYVEPIERCLRRDTLLIALVMDARL